MRRLTLDLLAVLLLCASSIVVAAEAEIGSSKILLPEIEGLELITRDSPGLHPITSRLAHECDGKQCGMYSGALDRAGMGQKTWGDLQPFFLVEILNDELVVRPDEFAGFMDRLKADTGTLRTKMAESVSELQFDVNIESEHGSELAFSNVSAEASEDIQKTEAYMAIAIHGLMNYKREDGSIVSHPFDATIAFVHVRDKILLTMLYIPDNSTVRNGITVEKVVEELVRRNDRP